MGEIYGNPASVPVVATSDHPLLGGSGESRLKNPLRKICKAGSVRGESKMGHGGPKRARSWKRRIGPRKAYRLWRSPLLGDRCSTRRCWSFVRLVRRWNAPPKTFERDLADFSLLSPEAE